MASVQEPVHLQHAAGFVFTQEALSASGHVHDLIEQRAEWLGLAVEAAHVGGKAPLVVKQRPGDSMFGFGSGRRAG
jgi:hypothetical protein